MNQRFGILVHQVLERYHGGVGSTPGLPELLGLLEAGWRRGGFGDSEEERQFRAKATQALVRYHDRFARRTASRSGSSAPSSSGSARTCCAGASTASTGCPDGGYELIDYKTGRPKTAAQLREDVQLSLYAVGARESWELEAASQSYYYVLDDEKVPVERSERGPRLDHRDRHHRRRRHPVPGLRADAVVVGVLDVRLPDRLPGRRALIALLAALAEEALELARQHVAGRERARVGAARLLVGGALEALDEGLDVRVELDRAGDLRSYSFAGVLEVGRVDGHADQRLQPAQQRQRALRVRRDRDVVRHRRPQRGRGQAGVLRTPGAGRRRCPSGPRRSAAAARAAGSGPGRSRGR